MCANTNPTIPLDRIKITWPKLPDDFVLPDDPVENSEHPLLANALRQALPPELVREALITTNFALCAGIRDRIVCKAADWMYVRPLEPWTYPYPRRSYTPHAEGPIPWVVMEFLSETYGEEYSMEFQQRVGKWYFYEQVIKVPTYVIFRPQTGHLEVYSLEANRYQLQTSNDDDRYWIQELDLFLGIWQGTREDRTGNWLRWWNAQGEMLPWPEERAERERQRADTERQRADTERQRAERLAERLRQMGVDPEG